jgi:hypothetical protein
LASVASSGNGNAESVHVPLSEEKTPRLLTASHLNEIRQETVKVGKGGEAGTEPGCGNEIACHVAPDNWAAMGAPSSAYPTTMHDAIATQEMLVRNSDAAPLDKGNETRAQTPS